MVNYNAFSIVIEIWWMVNEILNWNLIDSIKHVIVYMKKLIRTCIFCSFFEKMKFKTTHLLTNGNLVRCGCKGKKRNQKRSSRPAQSAGLAMYVDVLSAVDKPHCCTSAAYRYSMQCFTPPKFHAMQCMGRIMGGFVNMCHLTFWSADYLCLVLAMDKD